MSKLLNISFLLFKMGPNGFRPSGKGGGSYSERYVIFRGVVANMLHFDIEGWWVLKKGQKCVNVFYGWPLSVRLKYSILLLWLDILMWMQDKLVLNTRIYNKAVLGFLNSPFVPASSLSVSHLETAYTQTRATQLVCEDNAEHEHWRRICISKTSCGFDVMNKFR